jgi:hypothetical protein
MRILARSLLTLMLSMLLLSSIRATPQRPAHRAKDDESETKAAILQREQAGKLMPATVFFRGQSAPVQGRNSAGLQLPDGRLLLAAMVDTAGYSSALQQTYQAYLLVEFAVEIGDRTLPPGAYGVGFVEGDHFVVLDVGGNELMRATAGNDTRLARPNPLQILPDPDSRSRFRLYEGRNYIVLEPRSKIK